MHNTLQADSNEETLSWSTEPPHMVSISYKNPNVREYSPNIYHILQHDTKLYQEPQTG